MSATLFKMKIQVLQKAKELEKEINHIATQHDSALKVLQVLKSDPTRQIQLHIGVLHTTNDMQVHLWATHSPQVRTIILTALQKTLIDLKLEHERLTEQFNKL